MKDYLLLTGATGLLGRYLVRNLLAGGERVAVLVRPSRKKSPAVRVEGMMRTLEQEVGRPLPRPMVLTGDIIAPDLGLEPKDIRWAADHCGRLLHNAASLSFVSAGPQTEPWRSNVGGTQNVLEFCRQASIQKFFHVSTAYVAGKRTDRVMESDLDVGQEFGNPYEESKAAAEKIVREASFINRPTIFRPGIIIGDSETGTTTTFHNFYAMLQMAHTLIRQMGRWDFTGYANSSHVSFDARSLDRKHLVPVNWVGRVMSHIVRSPEWHGRTYHLTPRCPVTVRLMRDVLEQALQTYGVEFDQANAHEDASEAQQLFNEHMHVYDSYWRDDPIFDTTNTQAAIPSMPCPHVDRTMLMRMAETAIDMRFNWNDPKVEPAPLEKAEKVRP